MAGNTGSGGTVNILRFVPSHMHEAVTEYFDKVESGGYTPPDGCGLQWKSGELILPANVASAAGINLGSGATTAQTARSGTYS